MPEMLINKRIIKKLRTEKLWSQEELATACAVSLRTIQRAEGEGSGSRETIKALAAVFAVPSSEFIILNKGFDTYHNIQLGVAILLIMLAIALFETWLFQAGKLGILGFQLGIVFCAIIAGVFATLSTRVDAHKISWYFGVGLIRKSVALEDVQSHRPVRNKAWWGLGIRLISGGWLYNVSGLSAVELGLKNGKKIRIGTDEPDEFNSAIKQALRNITD